MEKRYDSLDPNEEIRHTETNLEGLEAPEQQPLLSDPRPELPGFTADEMAGIHHVMVTSPDLDPRDSRRVEFVQYLIDKGRLNEGEGRLVSLNEMSARVEERWNELEETARQAEEEREAAAEALRQRYDPKVREARRQAFQQWLIDNGRL